MDEDSQAEPLLDRPVRSLLDVKIGTVLKAYAIYLAIGLVIFLVVAIFILVAWSHSGKGGGAFGTPGGLARNNGGGASVTPGSLAWDPHAGETVTPEQFSSVPQGARIQAVRNRFGEPATTSRNPLDLVDGNQQTCLDYRSSASGSALFLFCFENGRLVEKQKF